MIGGYKEGQEKKEAWVFHTQSEIWSQAPDLPGPRRNVACGSIRDGADGVQVVIAAGGYHDGYLESTVIWEPGTTNWVQGPDLPIPIANAASVIIDNGASMLLVGGVQQDGNDRLDTLYRIQCSNRTCQWTLMEQRLEIGRSDPVAMLISDSLANCSEN